MEAQAPLRYHKRSENNEAAKGLANEQIIEYAYAIRVQSSVAVTTKVDYCLDAHQGNPQVR